MKAWIVALTLTGISVSGPVFLQDPGAATGGSVATLDTTPTAEVSASPTPGALGFAWGDLDCSEAISPVDSLRLLRFDAGLLIAQDAGCPGIGSMYDLGNAEAWWGDVDCSGAINPVDSLKLLRFDAGLPIAQAVGCPAVGDVPVPNFSPSPTPVSLAIEVGLVAEGDDEDSAYSNQEIVSPGSIINYLVAFDNDSVVPLVVAAISDDNYGAVDCHVEGGANIIGLVMAPDDGDAVLGPGNLLGGADELICVFTQTAGDSGETVTNNVTGSADDGGGNIAVDYDNTTVIVN